MLCGCSLLDDLFFGYARRQAFLALHFSASPAHRRRLGRASGRSVAVLWKLRALALNLHRWLGRFYLLEVALGSLAGLVMATVSEEGLPTHLGFGALAVLWFFTGLQAYRMVLRGNIAAHRQWMIRNFALTLAAVTLRNYMPLMLFVLHWPFRPTYITVSWLCWVPNLLIAEWLIRRQRPVQNLL